jgi:hypothetical protein
MNSYISLLQTNTISPDSKWLTSSNVFNELSSVNKRIFLLEQSLILGHTRFAYDGESTFFIKEYTSKLNNSLESIKDIYPKCYDMCKFLLFNNQQLPACTIDDVTGMLSGWENTIENPSPVSTNFYIPMLHFLLNRQSITAGTVETYDYTSVAIPSFIMIGRVCQVDFLEVGSYKCNINNMNMLGNAKSSYFGYLSCINFYHNDIAGIVAQLANQVMHNDKSVLINKIGHGTLFHHIKDICVNNADNNIDNNITPNVKQKFTAYLNQLVEKNIPTHADVNKLANILYSKNVEKEERILNYLNLENKDYASIETYMAYKDSIFNKMDYISMEADEDTGGDDDATDDEDPSGDSIDFDKDFGMDEKDASGDDESDDDTFDDDESDSDSGSGDDDTTDDDKPSVSEDAGYELGDQKGITIELAKGETLNSYMFRTELGQHLTSILNDPPKFLNNVQLQYIKNIKMYWLNLLSIKCVTEMISKVVKIPIYIKLKQNEDTN